MSDKVASLVQPPQEDPWAEFRIQPQQAPAQDPWAEFRVKQPSARPGLQQTMDKLHGMGFAQGKPSAHFDATEAELRAAAPPTPGVAEDIAKTAVPSVVRGTAGLAGMPGDLQHMNTSIWDKGVLALTHGVQDLTGIGPQKGTPEREQWDRAFGAASPGGLPAAVGMQPGSEPEKAFNQQPLAKVAANETFLPSGGDIVGAIEGVTGPMYKPKTVPGQFANTIGEFAPNFFMGGAPGIARRAATNIIAPAVASEAAGQFTKGTPYEIAARIAGAAAGGVGSSFATRPNVPGQAVARNLAGVTEEQYAAAQRLVDDARQRGVNLTAPEAIAQATDGASTITNLQRIVESSPGGSGTMRQFMAQRPGQIESAGRRAFNEISDPITSPDALGRDLGRAADDVILSTERQINNASRPFYDAARSHVIDPMDFEPIMRDPAFASSLKRLRSDPVLGPRYVDLPDNSVGIVDAVTKDMRGQAQKAANSANPGFNPERGAAYTSGASDARDIARTAARGGSEAYDTALVMQENARRKFLEPLEKGYIGKIRDKPEVKGAIDVLFPSAPLPGAANDVGQAVATLGAKSPETARRLVRAHVESVFDEATQRLQSGPNEWGGAKFSVALTGNPSQRASLKAAIEALPGSGKETWTGFERFLDTLEATGRRQQPGSQTAFNTEELARLKAGGLVGESVNAAKGGGLKIPDRVKEAYERAQLFGNTKQLAKIFTDKEGVQHLKRLAEISPTSDEAIRRTLRLMYIAGLGKASAASGQ